MNSNLTVEILIPTYNRSLWAEMQCKSLLSLRQELLKSYIDLSVIVSDNQSIAPVNIPENLKSFCKVIRPDQHLETAEENLIFGLKSTTAEYVWVLGDDDTIYLDNLTEMFRAIKSKKPEFIIANSSGALADGRFVKSRTTCSIPGNINSLPDFIQRTGFWFVIAGFSCLIFRRETLIQNIHSFNNYFRESKIYSHVFWLLDTFWSKSFLYYEKPIVIYKQNVADIATDDHWDKVAQREDVFIKYFWTVGFIKQANVLRKKHNIHYGFFSVVLDQNWEGRFLHLPLVIDIFFDVLEGKFLKRKTQCRAITQEEKELCVEFFSYEDPLLSEILATAQVNLARQGNVGDARLQLEKFRHQTFWNHFFVKELCGWNVYKIDRIYRAVPSGQEMHYISLLSDISPPTSSNQIVASELHELEALIFKASYPLINNSQVHIALNNREISLLKKFVKLYEKLKYYIPSNIMGRFKKILR